MKVLHVISDRNVGGAGILLCNLLRCFSSEEVESVVALPEESLLLPRLRALGVRTVELKYPCEDLSIRSVFELRRLIRKERPDLLHANAAVSARIAAKSKGCTVVHTRHCFYPVDNEPTSIRVTCGGWINSRLSDLVIATSEGAAENLQSLGVKPQKIRTIPNGSHAVRAVDEEELSEYRHKWSLSPQDLCIGIAARLVECKGHRTFLLAAARLRARLPSHPLRFLIAGEGEMRKELEQMSESMGLAPFVRFLGFVEDLAPFYRLLSVNVNCSVGTETSCLALSEGMSAGVATVASDYGGNREMLGEGSAGVLVPTADPDALAEALAFILEDPERMTGLQEAARRQYEKKYTATRMAEATVAVYREALQRKKHRRDGKVDH